MEIKKVAVFAGTFDPITNGHLDLIKRGLKMFDEIIVLIAINPNKTPYFSLNKRLNFIKEATKDLKHIKVDYTDGLTTKYAKDCGAKYLLRGVRNKIDKEFEDNLSKENHLLNPSIKTIVLKASPKCKNISSSEIVKRIKKGEDVSSLIPFSLI